jgi:hypothetical protein
MFLIDTRNTQVRYVGKGLHNIRFISFDGICPYTIKDEYLYVCDSEFLQYVNSLFHYVRDEDINKNVTIFIDNLPETIRGALRMNIDPVTIFKAYLNLPILDRLCVV